MTDTNDLFRADALRYHRRRTFYRQPRRSKVWRRAILFIPLLGLMSSVWLLNAPLVRLGVDSAGVLRRVDAMECDTATMRDDASCLLTRSVEAQSAFVLATEDPLPLSVTRIDATNLDGRVMQLQVLIRAPNQAGLVVAMHSDRVRGATDGPVRVTAGYTSVLRAVLHRVERR